MIHIVNCHQFYSSRLPTEVQKEPADNEETEVDRIKVDEIDPETSSNVDEESNDEHQGITIELKKKYD